MNFKRYKMVEYNCVELFQNKQKNCASRDWEYCQRNHTFKHRDDCEFIMYIEQKYKEDFEEEMERMTEQGCSKKLIKVIKKARKQGVDYILLYE